MDDSTPIEPVIDTTPTGPTYIVTFEELASTQGAIVQKEVNDKLYLSYVFQPSPDVLKTQLLVWASLGFPANWVVFTAQASPPVVCSDGQTRKFYEYVLYLLGNPIQTYLDTLNAQVLGVSFNFFLKDVDTIGLNVSKV
jgi:hypothetical protein